MTHCIYEFWFYIRKKPGIVLFTILAGAIGIALILCTERLAGRTQDRNQEYDRIFEDGEYSILADCFFEDVEKELKAKPQYWDILREFNEWLHESEEFEYLEIREQHSVVVDYHGREENHYMYEAGDEPRVEHWGDINFCNIKAIWLGEEVFPHFNLKVSEGRLFETGEFDYYFDRASDEPLPVLMGANFRGDYQVGDIIQVSNFTMQGKARVIGFLEEGSIVMKMASVQCIDRYLVFPMIHVFGQPELPEDRGFFRSLYYEKNNGILYSGISLEDLQEMILEKCERLGIAGGYIVCGADNQPAADLGMGFDDAVKIIRHFAAGISVFSIAALLIYLMVKIKKSGRYYAILLINGFSQRDIAAMAAGEAVVILGLSGLLGTLSGTLISRILFPRYRGETGSILFMLAASGIVAVAVSLWSYWRVDLSAHLKGSGAEHG